MFTDTQQSKQTFVPLKCCHFSLLNYTVWKLWAYPGVVSQLKYSTVIPLKAGLVK